MLDRKTKDFDASVELLKDRKKYSKNMFLMFYILSLVTYAISFSFISLSFVVFLAFLMIGILGFILATWLLLIHNQYCFYLFLIKKKVVKADKERK